MKRLSNMSRYPSLRRDLPRVCFLSYRHIRELAAPVVAEYADRAEIEVVDGTFDRTLGIARDRAERGVADVFVSAGSNAHVLRGGLQAPVATIQLTGFDILQALLKARELADRVGIVMYGATIPELDAVKGLLNIQIAQYAYQTPADARQHFETLRRDGFRVIVGSSLVVELAEQAGLTGFLAYSQASIRQGFNDALELARVARLEAGRYERLNSVLHTLQDAVLAVDGENRVIAANPRMQQLMGVAGDALMGQDLARLQPELSLLATLEHGADERGRVQRFQGRDWIVNRSPIRERGMVAGAALTLYDARQIQEADVSLRMQHRRLQRSAKHSFEQLIGASPSFRQTLAAARRYAHTDSTVLIRGESGVGKELFAQAMHNAGARATRPFIAVNCAAFPETLLESELFGYEEGAFTGSRRGGKPGLFEAAHTGTLFLDEIGDMPMPLQSRLLRVLQEREVTRLGATAAIPVDVRIIAATHQPLEILIDTQRFRRDLYYRINTLRLALAPLRERREDVVLLAGVLLKRQFERVGCVLDVAAVLGVYAPMLQAYGWPGNVRELENLCERIAVFMAQFGTIDMVDWTGLRQECPELAARDAGDEAIAWPSHHARAIAALKRHDGNRQAAAHDLGVSRSTLWRWLSQADDHLPVGG